MIRTLDLPRNFVIALAMLLAVVTVIQLIRLKPWREPRRFYAHADFGMPVIVSEFVPPGTLLIVSPGFLDLEPPKIEFTFKADTSGFRDGMAQVMAEMAVYGRPWPDRPRKITDLSGS